MERIQIGGRRVVGFGVGAWYSTGGSDELAALIKVQDTRMKTLTDAFAAFGPKWAITNPAAFNDFITDYGILGARYAAAKLAAANATGLWATVSDVDKAYAALVKAFTQNSGVTSPRDTTVTSPTDATRSTVKGDWENLFKRLNDAQKAAGAPVTVDDTPNDLAKLSNNSIAMAFYRSTAPVDIVAQLTGKEAPHENVKDALDAIAWIENHKGTIAIVATVVVGGLVYAIVRR